MNKSDFVRKLKEEPRERALRDLHQFSNDWFYHNEGWATKAWVLLKEVEESEDEIIEDYHSLISFLEKVDPNGEFNDV